MELDKTMGIGFYNFFLQSFQKYFHVMEEVRFVQCKVLYVSILVSALNSGVQY